MGRSLHGPTIFRASSEPVAVSWSTADPVMALRLSVSGRDCRRRAHHLWHSGVRRVGRHYSDMQAARKEAATQQHMKVGNSRPSQKR
jgi:hypothetical protein